VSLTVTDQFCGAGGSSIGAESIDGVELRLAMNHWRRAIETHQTNFPNADHDCADISATDPRRYPTTDVLLTSPECTNHSLAKGTSRKATAPHLFESNNEVLARVEAERSRATMWDVPRFAEFHDYQAIVVENVVEARQWSMFPAWWQAMECLGYKGHSVYLNSMFFPPTPQSRDRMYVVCLKKGKFSPNLDFRPPALCCDCERIVESVQTWKKPDRPWGRYRQQYVYRCPTCTAIVEPIYTPAFTAIDWSDLGQRIGDRTKPLAPATMARIKAGLQRYGHLPAAVPAGGNTYERVPENAIRYRTLDQPLRTQSTSERDSLVVPFIAELRGGSSDASSIMEALATIVASGNHHALVVPPAYIVRNNDDDSKTGWQTTPAIEAFRTFTVKGHQSLLVPLANKAMAKSVEEAMGTLHTKDRFALVVPTERGSSGTSKKARSTDEHLPTQTARQTLGLLMTPGGDFRPVEKVLSTFRTTTRDAILAPVELEVEDCGFRMLQPAEIGAGMAFPSTYVVTGNKREQVKQYGNAVTPPVMSWLVGRIADALGSAA
jgi:DNA (cytosine-5)-methyltransferase 1